jgi:two-component system nitrogen regulation response regulator GlnG
MAAAESSQSESQGTLNLARIIDDLLKAKDPEVYRKLTLAFDHMVLQIILRHTKGNQLQACELLGISRTTLRAKLRKLGVAIEKTLSPASHST